MRRNEFSGGTRRFVYYTFLVILFLLGLFTPTPTLLSAADWPMWRYNASHNAASPEELPYHLYLQWVRHLPTPRPAWPPEQYKLQFDLSYYPVIKDDLIFVPSMVRDRLTAYNIETGAEKWRFYAEGPIRLAPAAWKDKVYFVSDDGYLYCLRTTDGKLLWKFRGGPANRLILGNERLINSWPARGAPVIYDNTVYFAAGIWPFMGVFLHAVNADTGEVIWTNSGSGAMYLQQQHNSNAFAGLAPQGYIAVAGDKLLYGSRTVPACYDRRSGKFLYYQLSNRAYGKYVGGYDVAAWREWFFNNGVFYRLSDGKGIAKTTCPVQCPDTLLGLGAKGILMAYTLDSGKSVARGLGKTDVKSLLDTIHIVAGSRVFGSKKGGYLAAVDIPRGDAPTRVSWQGKIDGEVWTMLAAHGKLFVISKQGTIYCFGAEKLRPTVYRQNKKVPVSPTTQYIERAATILDRTDRRDGYALVLGLRNIALVPALLQRSNLYLVIIDSDSNKIARWRRQMDDSGWYGSRVAALTGDITTLNLPPYLAELVIIDDPDKTALAKGKLFLERLYSCLRPYGGTAYFAMDSRRQVDLFTRIASLDLPRRSLESEKNLLLLKRRGPLPGSADWTHQYGDIANTVCSRDELVKLPLGVLWFGDRSWFSDVLPRHGHGPPEQVIGGRLFIEGIKCLSARDVYTGRVLWKTILPELDTYGLYYDDTFVNNPFDLTYNQVHIPGANARGTNYIATEDEIFVALKDDVQVLDARTGRRTRRIDLPPELQKSGARWGYIGIYGEYLLGSAGYVGFSRLLNPGIYKANANVKKLARFFDKIASRNLLLFARKTGKLLWQVKADHGFIHNGIVAGRNRVFCLDRIPPYVESNLQNKKRVPDKPYRIIALDAASGKILWQKQENIFGTWLGYSQKYDILLQATRHSRDTLPEPDKGMAAYRGSDGKLLWQHTQTYSGPCILLDKRIITQGKAFDLLTGKPILYKNPLTGKEVPWQYNRNHGCNFVIGSRHLLTFRSAAAGFYSLDNDGGTGNFGGFRSGCTSNLIAADGVLNAPDYTHTCTCSYQNQTSLALVHMPDVELWTFNGIPVDKGPLRDVGLNFGAPGDHRDGRGTLWLEYPIVGGPSPGIDIVTRPLKPLWFRRHSSVIRNSPYNWVVASGLKGIRQIKIKIGNKQSEKYSVRLLFAEPLSIKPGQRVFSIALQGKTVIKNFDIVDTAGGSNKAVSKTFDNIPVKDYLVLDFTTNSGCAYPEPVVCGLELHRQDKPSDSENK